MKLSIAKNEKKEIFINMQHEIFKGNVLDIGTDNYGVIYNLYKQYNDETSVEYVHGKEESKDIKKGNYDNCVMLFSLNNIWFKFNKRNFIKDISEYLKQDGILHIWDINKGYFKYFNAKIKILLPGRKIKEIDIRDLNFFKDISKESTINIIKEYFEVIDLRASDNIYYIRAKKINRVPNDIKEGS